MLKDGTLLGRLKVYVGIASTFDGALNLDNLIKRIAARDFLRMGAIRRAAEMLAQRLRALVAKLPAPLFHWVETHSLNLLVGIGILSHRGKASRNPFQTTVRRDHATKNKAAEIDTGKIQAGADASDFIRNTRLHPDIYTMDSESFQAIRFDFRF